MLEIYSSINADAEEETIAKLEENVAKLPSITNMLKEGKSPDDIFKYCFGWFGT
ncbi:hypothetical protein [Clostridioides difficile]|uniref:hypothetical protein n=1 Tax=Clostridioides difficile TaxID=1496 RepID=UPI001F310708